jgi:hypothetical protein
MNDIAWDVFFWQCWELELLHCRRRTRHGGIKLNLRYFITIWPQLTPFLSLIYQKCADDRI